MPRNDTNYVCLRVTDEERKAYEEKLRKTRFSAKRFLLKLLHDEKLRESPPKTELEVRHQLFMINTNCFQLWAGKNASLEQRAKYYERYESLQDFMCIFVDLVYYGRLIEDRTGSSTKPLDNISKHSS